MNSKENAFLVILFVAIIFLSSLTLYFGGYTPFFQNQRHSFRLRDYLWFFSVVAVLLMILFDKCCLRRDEKRKVPDEGWLIKLKREQNREDHQKREDEYKL
ncbi:MAG: hypothetical protein ACOCSJ_01660 [Candidatus Natronoplasma sp.]